MDKSPGKTSCGYPQIDYGMPTSFPPAPMAPPFSQPMPPSAGPQLYQPMLFAQPYPAAISAQPYPTASSSQPYPYLPEYQQPAIFQPLPSGTAYIQSPAIVPPPPSAVQLMKKIKIPKVEFTNLIGKDNPRAPNYKEFDDYKAILDSHIKEGNQIRVAAIEIFSSGSDILGFDTYFDITEPSGKVNKLMHSNLPSDVKPKSHAKYVFPAHDFLQTISGKSLSTIKKLRFYDNHKKCVLEAGTNEGSDFMLVPQNKGPIIALSGSMANALLTLRAYAVFS